MQNIEIYHASAGCGKTSQLMTLLKEELQRGVSLKNIAFVSFTKAAASVALDYAFALPEFQEHNVSHQYGHRKLIRKDDTLYFRTIHSLCFREIGASLQSMMTEARYRRLGELGNFRFGGLNLRDFTETRIDPKVFKDNQLILFDNLYRNNPKYADELLLHMEQISYTRITQYQTLLNKFKKVNKYLDFTDLLERYQASGKTLENIEVAFIDEAQDLTPLQWQVCFQMFRNARALYITGDANQCLYSFTGASPHVLINMRGSIHYLQQSHRLPSSVLDVANKVLSCFTKEGRVHYDWWPVREGGTVKVLVNVDELPEPPKGKTMMLIARNRAFLKHYVKWCQERGYPYYQNDYDHPIFTRSDRIAYREGRVDDWDDEKKEFAKRCDEEGRLNDDPAILISTIHGVKGDEADIVCLMTDMRMASYKALGYDPDSEHRCFFVGVTRAKDTLYIVEPTTSRYYKYLI